MNTKSISTIVGFATAICLSCLGVPPASAQVVTLPAPPPGSVQGWSYAVAPYFWMPTIDTSLSAQGPRGGNVDFSTSIDIGTILRRLNFAAMIGAEARYERFSVMTDLLYMNVNNTTSESRLSSFNPGPGPIDIPRSGQLNAGTRLGTMIGSLAGGYTLLQGDWGNFDALAGIRLLNVNSTTNYNLSVAILLPNRTIGLSRNGSLTVNRTYVDGIGGVTGRINILNSKFYLPFYLDAGGGGIQFTWQAYGGIAYKIASWGDVSAGYRYLRFENGGTSQGVRDLSLSGALVALNCHFGSSPPPPPAPAPEVAMAAPAPAAAKTYLVFFDWDKATLTPRGDGNNRAGGGRQ